MLYVNLCVHGILQLCTSLLFFRLRLHSYLLLLFPFPLFFPPAGEALARDQLLEEGTKLHRCGPKLPKNLLHFIGFDFSHHHFRLERRSCET